MNVYYIYILLCENNSYYTGITTDIHRRFSEHSSKQAGAKYTKSHKPLKIMALWKTDQGRSSASKIEYKIKSLSRTDKEFLIKNQDKIAEILNIDSPVENCFIKFCN